MAIVLKTVSDSKQAQSDLKKLRQSVDGIQESTNKATKDVLNFGKALAAGFLAASGTKRFIEISDILTNLRSRLKVVTDTQESFNYALKETYAITIRTRSALSATGGLYSRLALASKAFGASQQDVLKVTELVAKATAVSGAGAQETRAAMIQFGQALASNRFSGDELRSVMENAPALARAVAEGMGIAYGELKKFGEAGKLTADKVFGAILNQTSRIEADFKKIEITYGAAFQQLRSSLIILFDSTRKAILGTRATFAKTISEFAQGLFNIATNLKFIIFNLKLNLLNFLFDAKNLITDLLESIKNGFSAVDDRFVNFYKRMDANLRIIVMNIGNATLAVFALIGSLFVDFIKSFEASPIAQKVVEVFRKSIAFVREEISYLLDNIPKFDLAKVFPGLDKTYQIVKAWVISIYELFVGLYNDLLGKSIIPDIVNGIKEWFKLLMDEPVEAIKVFVESVIAQLRTLLESTLKAPSIIGAAFGVMIFLSRSWKHVLISLITLITTLGLTAASVKFPELSFAKTNDQLKEMENRKRRLAKIAVDRSAIGEEEKAAVNDAADLVQSKKDTNFLQQISSNTKGMFERLRLNAKEKEDESIEKTKDRLQQESFFKDNTSKISNALKNISENDFSQKLIQIFGRRVDREADVENKRSVIQTTQPTEKNTFPLAGLVAALPESIQAPFVTAFAAAIAAAIGIALSAGATRRVLFGLLFTAWNTALIKTVDSSTLNRQFFKLANAFTQGISKGITKLFSGNILKDPFGFLFLISKLLLIFQKGRQLIFGSLAKGIASPTLAAINLGRRYERQSVIAQQRRLKNYQSTLKATRQAQETTARATYLRQLQRLERPNAFGKGVKLSGAQIHRAVVRGDPTLFGNNQRSVSALTNAMASYRTALEAQRRNTDEVIKQENKALEARKAALKEQNKQLSKTIAQGREAFVNGMRNFFGGATGIIGGVAGFQFGAEIAKGMTGAPEWQKVGVQMAFGFGGQAIGSAIGVGFATALNAIFLTAIPKLISSIFTVLIGRRMIAAWIAAGGANAATMAASIKAAWAAAMVLFTAVAPVIGIAIATVMVKYIQDKLATWIDNKFPKTRQFSQRLGFDSTSELSQTLTLPGVFLGRRVVDTGRNLKNDLREYLLEKQAEGYQAGGHITGAGTGTSDSIPAYLSHGEFVVNAQSARNNRGLLEAINNNQAKQFAEGGIVGPDFSVDLPLNYNELSFDELKSIFSNDIDKRAKILNEEFGTEFRNPPTKGLYKDANFFALRFNSITAGNINSAENFDELYGTYASLLHEMGHAVDFYGNLKENNLIKSNARAGILVKNLEDEEETLGELTLGTPIETYRPRFANYDYKSNKEAEYKILREKLDPVLETSKKYRSSNVVASEAKASKYAISQADIPEIREKLAVALRTYIIRGKDKDMLRANFAKAMFYRKGSYELSEYALDLVDDAELNDSLEKSLSNGGKLKLQRFPSGAAGGDEDLLDYIKEFEIDIIKSTQAAMYTAGYAEGGIVKEEIPYPQKSYFEDLVSAVNEAREDRPRFSNYAYKDYQKHKFDESVTNFLKGVVSDESVVELQKAGLGYTEAFEEYNQDRPRFSNYAYEDYKKYKFDEATGNYLETIKPYSDKFLRSIGFAEGGIMEEEIPYPQKSYFEDLANAVNEARRDRPRFSNYAYQDYKKYKFDKSMDDFLNNIASSSEVEEMQKAGSKYTDAFNEYYEPRPRFSNYVYEDYKQYKMDEATGNYLETIKPYSDRLLKSMGFKDGGMMEEEFNKFIDDFLNHIVSSGELEEMQKAGFKYTDAFNEYYEPRPRFSNYAYEDYKQYKFDEATGNYLETIKPYSDRLLKSIGFKDGGMMEEEFKPYNNIMGSSVEIYKSIKGNLLSENKELNSFFKEVMREAYSPDLTEKEESNSFLRFLNNAKPIKGLFELFIPLYGDKAFYKLADILKNKQDSKINELLANDPLFKYHYEQEQLPKFAFGGAVRGPGSPTSDSIPAMLSNGEFVVNSKSAKKNRDLLEAINSDKNVRYFQEGGGTVEEVTSFAKRPIPFRSQDLVVNFTEPVVDQIKLSPSKSKYERDNNILLTKNSAHLRTQNDILTDIKEALLEMDFIAVLTYMRELTKLAIRGMFERQGIETPEFETPDFGPKVDTSTLRYQLENARKQEATLGKIGTALEEFGIKTATPEKLKEIDPSTLLRVTDTLDSMKKLFDNTRGSEFGRALYAKEARDARALFGELFAAEAAQGRGAGIVDQSEVISLEDALTNFNNIFEGFNLSLETVRLLPRNFRTAMFDGSEKFAARLKAVLESGYGAEKIAEELKLLNDEIRVAAENIRGFIVPFTTPYAREQSRFNKLDLSPERAAFDTLNEKDLERITSVLDQMEDLTEEIKNPDFTGVDRAAVTVEFIKLEKEFQRILNESWAKISLTPNEQLQSRLSTFGVNVDTSVLNLLTNTRKNILDGILNALVKYKAALEDPELDEQRRIALQTQVELLKKNLGEIVQRATPGFETEAQRAGKSLTSSAREGLKQGFKDVLKGDKSIEDAGKDFLDRITGAVVDTFVEGLLTPLTDDKSAFAKLGNKLGEGIYSLLNFSQDSVYGGKEREETRQKGFLDEAQKQVQGFGLESAIPESLSQFGVVPFNPYGFGGERRNIMGTGEVPGFGLPSLGLEDFDAGELFKPKGPVETGEESAKGPLGDTGQIVGAITTVTDGLTAQTQNDNNNQNSLFGLIATSVTQIVLAAAASFKEGGLVSGAGTSTSDSIPAMLSNGEFVINAKATKNNFKLLTAINKGKVSKYFEGGLINPLKFADGGFVNNAIPANAGGIPVETSITSFTGSDSQNISINITGDISRQTRQEIYTMLPTIAQGVNMHNKERGYKGSQ